MRTRPAVPTTHTLYPGFVLAVAGLLLAPAARSEPTAPPLAAEPATAADVTPAVLDCPTALDRFEALVRAYLEQLGWADASPAALAAQREELRAADDSAGRYCLRYYTRGLELYAELAAAEQRAGRAPTLPIELPPPAEDPAKRPEQPLIDYKVEEFERPVISEARPEVCLIAPLRPDAGLMIGIVGLVLGSAIGISLLQFDGEAEQGFGYAFFFASAAFTPSAGHYHAGEHLPAWLWVGARAAASAVSIAGLARGNDTELNQGLTFGGLAALSGLIVGGLIDGVLAAHRTNELCAQGTEAASGE